MTLLITLRDIKAEELTENTLDPVPLEGSDIIYYPTL